VTQPLLCRDLGTEVQQSPDIRWLPRARAQRQHRDDRPRRWGRGRPLGSVL